MIEPQITFLDFCLNVRTLCSIYNASVTSWSRTAAHNKAVGGVATSRHLLALAVDVVLDHQDQTADLIAAARGLGLQAVNEGSHVHIELDAVNTA